MPLPELIEVVPLASPVDATVTVPGSKSITNRALVLAALAQGETLLEGALWSDDTRVMVDALRVLGFRVDVAPAPDDACNRTIAVQGRRGEVGQGGTLEQPLELFVGNAGTAARFLTALVCLGRGVYRIHGAERMHQRPQEALFDALRELGYCIDSVNSRLPADIHGGGPRQGQCCVSLRDSSQFASALLLCARAGGWHVNVLGANPEESAYVRMTHELIRAFPGDGGTFHVEPDASSGSYFWAAQALQPQDPHAPHHIAVAHWPRSGWQIDARFPECLPLPHTLSRQTDLGDSIITAIAIAPLATHPVRFTDLSRLRVQECERVAVLRTELARCGAQVRETGDTLDIRPGPLHGATIQTYDDHRIAMSFAILGLKVPGLKIHNPACVKKTFPNFFQKLAAPPPDGLGVTILDAVAGTPLAASALVAE
ncbi:MAG: 3-phosphoshikimate 1-carboxyvinyltransferase [Verrucomicrobia bacterium]|nr:3-phosphoshikimate 1-carboxyvinyltransferase [Verrucomicrobiota bacterium]